MKQEIIDELKTYPGLNMLRDEVIATIFAGTNIEKIAERDVLRKKTLGFPGRVWRRLIEKK